MSDFNKIFASLSFFVESPDYFEGGVFYEQMNDIDYNKKIYQHLYPQLTKIKPFKGYDVFERDHPLYGSENKTYYLVKENAIEGAIEIETRKNNNFCLGVWQRNVFSNKELMRSFFINYLSNIYDSIVSGKVANKLGMLFWKKLLDFFIKNKTKVTIFSGNQKEELPYNDSEFEEYWTHIKQDKKSIPTFVSGNDKLFKFYF